jgi:hypothetical protein
LSKSTSISTSIAAGERLSKTDSGGCRACRHDSDDGAALRFGHPASPNYPPDTPHASIPSPQRDDRDHFKSVISVPMRFTHRRTSLALIEIIVGVNVQMQVTYVYESPLL